MGWALAVVAPPRRHVAAVSHEGVANAPVHPSHDACFTPTGVICVAEWVSTGRITKLERVS
jgi:hypothetical protein